MSSRVSQKAESQQEENSHQDVVASTEVPTLSFLWDLAATPDPLLMSVSVTDSG